jgi:hypothetical protein
VQVVVFTAGERPDLVVGESLVPAVIPILRDLGVEDEIRSFSKHKPGATFTLTSREVLSFPFRNVRGPLPPYAYNSPRALFDETLERAAQRAGAHVIAHRATLHADREGDHVLLSDATLAAASEHLKGQPDLIVDATGRARLIARLLEIPSKTGPRKDASLFAHFDKVKITVDGDVHIDRLDRGWAWRIPLPDRVSLGIVVNADALEQHGASREEQFDHFVASDSILSRLTEESVRLTPVFRYSNYQLVSQRLVGANWVMVGDAAGFIDPVFSSGLFIAMDSAQRLARAIRRGSPGALARYDRHVRQHLETWQWLVDLFYNGRLLTLLRLGQRFRQTLIAKVINPHMQRHVGRVFTGAASNSRYSLGLLRFMTTHALRKLDHTKMQIR